ncbi:phospholipid-translocating p-type flippase family protein, putative [Ichthyophthirius multifiliis]|uniref:Phospholipid-transporting ATPase n=1 Tax=Ichthyophthirius multifiliis TaxID=5932 RepID=G0QMN1_ICHMU|nr:phospholipid-translocating p-type flippase family protein, putative [Ichthyophthirius multifiliis]EGR33523.1 phospholipid-translocating p-type flippase family protein, putative [Ichthyophthirius multifiliis]|eukprot:XP_004037509.1 phospholipid-translocating p-type flippase family protein, putative [Ichthyophthirius multifiliis]
MNQQLIQNEISKQNYDADNEQKKIQLLSINYSNLEQENYQKYIYDDSNQNKENIELQFLRKQTQSEKKSFSIYHKLKDRLSGIKESNWDVNIEQRRIKIGENNLKYPSNQIRTSRYTIISFLPLNLFEQFSKLANIYFLVMGFLQMIPQISNTFGIPTVYLPLFLVLCIGAIKDIVEDLKRHSSDKEENQQIIHKIEDEQECKKLKIMDIFSENILCGNIIKIKENQQIPADILLLKTSDLKGSCFIETKNLDGETNLKPKFVYKDINNLLNEKQLFNFNNMNIYVNYESPNPLLYKFNGNIQIGKQIISLDEKNIALRGCFLRNTSYIYGVVIYTGHECKIMLNSHSPELKRSNVEKIMNKLVFFVWICQNFLCALGGLWYTIWHFVNKSKISYIYIDKKDDFNSAELFFQSIGNWLMIFLNFIPVSLVISLEMIRYLQGMIICNEKLMKSKHGIHANVQSSNLNEDLGQIQCIFSDKTGTLTCNIMSFKSFYLDGKVYGDINAKGQKQKDIENVNFEDERILKEPKNQKIKDFLLHLACCHEIIYNEKVEKYQASSPDDLALVNFAKFCGFQYLGKDNDDIIQIKESEQNKIWKFKLLNLIEFTSDRKRMSIIIQDQETEKICLLIKGADSAIIPRFTSQEQTPCLLKILEEYSEIGLRTLVLGKKDISNQEYQDFNIKYQKAASLLKNRDEAIEELAQNIEQNITFIGATAIEDELQDEVGETIEILKKAGICFWILTGDKKETAINIAISTKVLTTQDTLVEITPQNLFNIHINDKKTTIIITGDSISEIFQDDIKQSTFSGISSQAKSVIACRVSPKQKKELVYHYKLHPKNAQKRTLAIGDGANDVSMILEAHVGVGIKGLEGMQAARSADYSIGEFKLLRRLLLFHGRECYRRNSVVILYNFYKNVMYLCPMLFLGFFSGFSGAFIYDLFLFQCFNAVFTAFPIVFYAVMDKDLSSKVLVNSPSLYRTGIEGMFMNNQEFFIWFLGGFWHAAAIFFVFMFSMDSVGELDGRMNDQVVIGQSIFMISVVIGNIKVCIHSYLRYSLQFILQILSIGIYLIILTGSNFYLNYELWHVLNKMLVQPYFYLCFLAALGSTVVLEYGLVVFKEFLFYMQLRDQFKEEQYLNNNIKQFAKINDLNKFMNTVRKDYKDESQDEDSATESIQNQCKEINI